MVGRREIMRDWPRCDLTVGKGSSSLPPNLTPVVLLQSLELLAYSVSVFLDHLTLLMVKFTVLGMCWLVILFLIFFFWCTGMVWLKAGLRDTWPAVALGDVPPHLTWQVKRDRTEFWCSLLEMKDEKLLKTVFEHILSRNGSNLTLTVHSTIFQYYKNRKPHSMIRKKLLKDWHNKQRIISWRLSIVNNLNF